VARVARTTPSDKLRAGFVRVLPSLLFPASSGSLFSSQIQIKKTQIDLLKSLQSATCRLLTGASLAKILDRNNLRAKY
jgi:hypothetical protein